MEVTRMETLSLEEMTDVNGGSLCAVEGFITALSCYCLLAVACVVGAAGNAIFCQ
jgi:hypothetical protein